MSLTVYDYSGVVFFFLLSLKLVHNMMHDESIIVTCNWINFFYLKCMYIFTVSFHFQLKCCGYQYGGVLDFPSVRMFSIGLNSFLSFTATNPLFCCHSNPLTRTYNSDFSICTSSIGSEYRYTEVSCYLIIFVPSNAHLWMMALAKFTIMKYHLIG